jgi:hypothetical protein
VRALEFWKTVAVDEANFLEEFVQLLRSEHLRFCVIDGQALNAYVEPLVTLDLDLVIAGDQLQRIVDMARKNFRVEQFPHSINISARHSNLRVQFQTDPRYLPYLDRATERDVLGLRLPVASPEDVLEGKIWAVQDPERRGSKRQKDLADIARLLEAFPALRARVPQDILDRLF